MRVMKKQLELNIYQGKHGGRRPFAGRSRQHSKGVSHATREKVKATTPLHINFKYRAFIRTEGILKVLELSIANASKLQFSVTHFTLQSNHIHLIAEAGDNKILSSGMRSLTNTMVKRIGKGSIQLERYHLHVLKTPREVRNAIDYVLNNDIKHTGKQDRRFTKVISSGKCWLLKTHSH